jgi:hypothetical protein
LFWLAVITTVGGLAVLVFDFARFRSEPPDRHAEHLHPVLVPLIQWVAVVIVWINLVIREGRENRAAKKTA